MKAQENHRYSKGTNQDTIKESIQVGLLCTCNSTQTFVFLQIYSRLGEDENRHESGVTAICTILMNYVETSRHIVSNTRSDKAKSYQKFEDRLRDISKCNLTFYYTGISFLSKFQTFITPIATLSSILKVMAISGF